MQDYKNIKVLLKLKFKEKCLYDYFADLKNDFTTSIALITDSGAVSVLDFETSTYENYYIIKFRLSDCSESISCKDIKDVKVNLEIKTESGTVIHYDRVGFGIVMD